MKYLPYIYLILVFAGGAYLRFEQPKVWDKLLDSLKAEQDKSVPAASPADVSGDATSSQPAISPPTAPPPRPAEMYITPDTTKFINSSHVKMVEQPVQPNHTEEPTQPATHKVFLPPNPIPAQPNWTWTTAEGKTFKNVIIIKVEADRVTIDHDQGTAILDITTLDPDIQKQLNYDPDLAGEAMAARHKDDNAAPVPAPAPAPSP